jgi:hypothetical protein
MPRQGSQIRTPISEPHGWRDVISESIYAPGGMCAVEKWVELPPDVQAFTMKKLAERRDDRSAPKR